MSNVLIAAVKAEPVESEQGADVAQMENIRQRAPNSISLTVLAVLGAIFMLYWARAFFIPLMFGVMISYALSPLVETMQKRRIPRSLGAALLLIVIVGGIGFLAYSLSDEAISAVETLPDSVDKFRKTLAREQGVSDSAMSKMQNATSDLEQAAQRIPNTVTMAPKGVTRVQIEKPKFNIQDYLWSGMMGAAGAAGQAAIVLFLAYFLMVSGDSFRRKIVRINGPTFARRKITLQAMDEITGQIQNYLLVQLFTSFVVGVVTWLAFLMVGLEHAAIWGIAAAIFNIIPYIGAVIVTIVIALVAFLQFGTFGMAIWVSGLALVITSLEGLLLNPLLTSRSSQMNPVAIFAGVLFWGWLWGVWGLLLGIPILMAIKAVCDRIEDLKPIGELLGK